MKVPPFFLHAALLAITPLAMATPRVVATTGMIADLTRQIAGDQADVRTLIGEGIDPHAYKPTRSDVILLQDADLILTNGLNLEGKMGTLLTRLGARGKPVVPVAERLSTNGSVSLLKENGQPDPHLWMDVAAWSKTVPVIAEALAYVDLANRDKYLERVEPLQTELAELAAYARASLGSIPESARVLVTAHDAFQYLGRAYGIEVRGIQGISTESEAGLRDIEDLVTFLVDRKIPAIFVETSVADKNVQALIEGAKARGHQVRIGGELFSDSMGAPGTYQGTYIGMMDHNITTITRALGGNAPERGWKGKLTP
ncbi:MAG: zinc ABC transporter substrate-binding protein [Candidatus Methylacidiphilales bacterium]